MEKMNNKPFLVFQHSPVGSYPIGRYESFTEAHELVCSLGQNNDYPTQAWYTIESESNNKKSSNTEAMSHD